MVLTNDPACELMILLVCGVLCSFLSFLAHFDTAQVFLSYQVLSISSLREARHFTDRILEGLNFGD